MKDFVEIELELDEETIEFIEKEARREGITVDEFVNKAITSFIEKYEENSK